MLSRISAFDLNMTAMVAQPLYNFYKAQLRPRRQVLSLAGALLGLACSSPPSQTAPNSFGEVPAEFTFDMTQKAVVAVTATPELLQGKAATMEVMRADGRVVYRGRVMNSGAVRMNLPIPVRDSELVVRLIAAGGTREAKIPVSAQGAEHNFR